MLKFLSFYYFGVGENLLYIFFFFFSPSNKLILFYFNSLSPSCPRGGEGPGRGTSRCPPRPPPALPIPANADRERKQRLKIKIKNGAKKPKCICPPPANAIGDTRLAEPPRWAGLVLHSGHRDPRRRGWQGMGTTSPLSREPPEPQPRFGPERVALFLLLGFVSVVFVCLFCFLLLQKGVLPEPAPSP